MQNHANSCKFMQICTDFACDTRKVGAWLCKRCILVLIGPLVNVFFSLESSCVSLGKHLYFVIFDTCRICRDLPTTKRRRWVLPLLPVEFYVDSCRTIFLGTRFGVAHVSDAIDCVWMLSLTTHSSCFPLAVNWLSQIDISRSKRCIGSRIAAIYYSNQIKNEWTM